MQQYQYNTKIDRKPLEKTAAGAGDNSADYRIMLLFQALRDIGYTIDLRPIGSRKMPCIVPQNGGAR